MARIIFPVLVLGSLSTKIIPSSFAKAPTSVLILWLISYLNLSSELSKFYPLRITKANGASPLTG